MSLFRRSLITWLPGFTSGDFIFKPVTAGLDTLEIRARQLNNWRLHEPPLPPTSFPSASQVSRLTRLYNSSMPRQHFRLPGRYTIQNLDICFFSLLVFKFSYKFNKWLYQKRIRDLKDHSLPLGLDILRPGLLVMKMSWQHFCMR